MTCCVSRRADWRTWIGAIFILLFGALDVAVEEKAETVKEVVASVAGPSDAQEAEGDEGEDAVEAGAAEDEADQ
jgi:hypothetical protein